MLYRPVHRLASSLLVAISPTSDVRRSGEMAKRVAAKAEKIGKGAPARAAKGKPAAAAPRDRLRELEAECADLRSELAAAATRLAALEAQRKQLLDRIDWAIDSLHSLIDK